MNFLLIPWIQLQTSNHFAVLHEEISCLDQEAFDQMSLAVIREASDQKSASVCASKPMFVLGMVEHLHLDGLLR